MKKCVVKVLLYDKEGSVLVLFRGMSHPNFPGHADLPGGELEGDDSTLSTAKREVQEETGITVSEADLDLSFEIEYDNVIHVLYTCKINRTSPKTILSWEHKEYRWMNLKKFLSMELQPDADRYFIDVLKHFT